MSILKKLFGEKPPPWADFMSGATYSKFGTDLKAELDRRNRPYIMDLQEGFWKYTDDGLDCTYGVMNLAQVYNAEPESSREAAISEHLDKVALIESTMGEERANWEEAQQELRVRIVPDDLAVDTSTFIQKPVTPSFLCLLALDKPDAIQFVVTSDVERWEQPVEELFEVALQNVHRFEQVEISRRAFGDITLTRAVADNFYAASHLLLLDRYITGEAPRGVLAAVPNRHMLIFSELLAEPSAIINALLPLVIECYEEGPGSISPDILWWLDGEFSRFEIVNDRGRAVIKPDEATRERLARLFPG